MVALNPVKMQNYKFKKIGKYQGRNLYEPMIEKTTIPANMEVKQFVRLTMIASR